MVRSIDKALINAAVSFFKARDWPKPSRNQPGQNPYAIAAKRIMELHPNGYVSFAAELGPIAFSFGFGNDADRKNGFATVRPETVAEQRNNLAKGANRGLFPVMLCWLWVHDRYDTQVLFETCGFPYIDAIAQLESADRTAADNVLVAPQNKNKFDLSFLLENAKDRIILVAQNHWHLISQPANSETDFWPKVAAAVERGVTVEIVAMHPDAEPPLPLGDVPDAIQLWTLYMKAPAFRSHVIKCWDTLDRFASLSIGS